MRAGAVVELRGPSVSCTTDRSFTVWTGALDPLQSPGLPIWKPQSGRCDSWSKHTAR
jgi:hypothetical protein